MENTRNGPRELCQLQHEHRSEHIMNRIFPKPLFTRKHKRDHLPMDVGAERNLQMAGLPWDPRYENYIRMAGFYHLHKIGHIPTDHALISALAERWRQETHTFHFPVGEMTITLQDVAVLLGLPIDGEALCLGTNCNWKIVVKDLLGRVDEDVGDRTFRSNSKVAINMSWLRRHFSICPEDANEDTVQKYARAYLFMMVGSLLFCDHSGDSISAIYLPLLENFHKAGQYSWGSGVLAYLYKELCLATKFDRKQFGGSVMLLQLWSWERLPIGRPRSRKKVQIRQPGENLEERPPLGYGWSRYNKFADVVTCRVLKSYRREIDELTDEKVKWLPYQGKLDLLPSICARDSNLWRTTAPLIHFWIVEKYNPGRVARQFNLYQQIPPSLCDTMEELHKLKNGVGKDWVEEHRVYLHDWEERVDKCLVDQTPYDHSEHDAYMRWFSRVTYLYLCKGVSKKHNAANKIQKIAMNIVERYKDVGDREIQTFARNLLYDLKELAKDIRLPVIDRTIFAALDNDPIEPAMVSPMHNVDPGSSGSPAT